MDPTKGQKGHLHFQGAFQILVRNSYLFKTKKESTKETYKLQITKQVVLSYENTS